MTGKDVEPKRDGFSETIGKRSCELEGGVFHVLSYLTYFESGDPPKRK